MNYELRMTNYGLGLVLVFLLGGLGCQAPEPVSTTTTLDTVLEIDSVSGLVIDQNFELVRGQCTACHSAKLITQSSASREGWEQMIRWMQQKQGLWDLGPNESPILDYLTAHYGIKKKGRRTPLTNIEWYSLEEQP